MVESYGKMGNIKNIKQSVFDLLNENSLHTAKTICTKLEIPYWQYRNYIYKLKCEWKSYRENELGSNCSSIHAWSGSVVVPDFVRRELAVEAGWIRTKAKNRWLLWRDDIGRMMWFENGRVKIYVRSPASPGKAKKLFCNGFYETGLIFEIRHVDEVFKSFKFSGAHYVYDAGKPLPKMTITDFEKSRGIVIKTGDKSHPRGVEVVSSCPDWGERTEMLMERFAEFLGGGTQLKSSSKKLDYVI